MSKYVTYLLYFGDINILNNWYNKISFHRKKQYSQNVIRSNKTTCVAWHKVSIKLHIPFKKYDNSCHFLVIDYTKIYTDTLKDAFVWVRVSFKKKMYVKTLQTPKMARFVWFILRKKFYYFN